MDASDRRQSDISTPPSNGFRLVTLGRLTLVDATGEIDQALAKRRRKLAVLAVLALSRRPVSRERLVEMFWGDEEEARSRHSLSDALSSLRRVLGPDSIATRQLDVSLSPGFPLTVDAAELIQAAERRDHGRVVALYRGAFLGCGGLADSTAFEDWASGLREQLNRQFLDACRSQSLALARTRRWDECAILARQWLEIAPCSADAALYLLNAVKAPGSARSYQAALDEYHLLEQRLERDFDQSPAEEVARLAASIRDELARMVERPVVPPEKVADGPIARDGKPPARRPSSSRLAAVPLAASLFFAATSFTSHGAMPSPGVAEVARPSVAVLDFRNVSGDSATAWLELGLPRMVASDIGRLPGLDVVSPERVREARQALDLPPGAALGLRDITRLGARTGAAWVVSGGILRGDSLYVLDVTVQDAAGTTPPRLFAVTSSSLIALADQAAARLAGLATAGGTAADFADGETSSVEAYRHYVRARQASDDGRLPDAVRELDAAIALDSSFASAIADRIPAAAANGETDVLRRLNLRLLAALERAAPFDRMRDAMDRAMHNGEHRRAESLARALVERYPRDSRASAALADVYTSHGRWDAADSVLTRELALDSLATVADARSCAPCVAYSGLSGLRAMRGDMAGAVQAAERWVNLQPNVAGGWSALMAVLSFDGRYDAALEAHRRASALTPNANYLASVSRILMMARRYDEADSVIARGLRDAIRTGTPDAIVDALDARALLERERGQLRRSARTVDSAVAVDPGATVLRLMAANSLARVGEYAPARAIYTPAASPVRPIAAEDARGFAWHHALLADAIAPVADTGELSAIADSIDVIGARSYYARDWRVAHHVRGLIAMRASDYARAEREFSAARWGVAGWTVTVVDLARAQMALGKAGDAVRTLRDAYAGPLDAMGRYEPRSDIDYWMSRAFAQAGMLDSARTYAGYAKRAWRTADPEVRKKLATLTE
jgi:DNA-binding SARP family transcriptional activator/TolB-like protein